MVLNSKGCSLRIKTQARQSAREKNALRNGRVVLVRPYIYLQQPRAVRAMFVRNGLKLIHKGSGPLACGPFAAYAFNDLPRVALGWNARVTDHLPMSFASGWYFVLRRSAQPAKQPSQSREMVGA